MLALLLCTALELPAQDKPAPVAPVTGRTSFVRMFPGLPPFAPRLDAYRMAVQQLGAAGGVLDAADNLSDPIQSIVNQPVFSPQNPDNPRQTAGVTFVGQFIDHDLTFDRDSPLTVVAVPGLTRNLRTPALDLDSVYGAGPLESPQLYDFSSGFVRLRVDTIEGSDTMSRDQTLRYDLPRDEFWRAIIGEARNDENIVVSQLHTAFLLLHNAVTEELAQSLKYDRSHAMDVFERARQTVRWHYQWIVLHEYMPAILGANRAQRFRDMLVKPGASTNRRFGEPWRGRLWWPAFESYRTPSPWWVHGAPPASIPVEFSAAAFRFGHSQVRPSYRINFGPPQGSPFFAFVFDPHGLDPNDPDPADLRGGVRAPRRFVDWQTFFDFGDGLSRNNKRIDSKISSVLMKMPRMLPVPLPGLPTDGEQSLPSRNLMRHVNLGLPSGQAIAAHLNVPALDAVHLVDLRPYGLHRSTPLWFYILREAEVLEDGLQLGPVGAHIVGEVLTNVVRCDPLAYPNVDPNWRPFLPSAVPDDFKMTDLLRYVGVAHPVQ